MLMPGRNIAGMQLPHICHQCQTKEAAWASSSSGHRVDVRLGRSSGMQWALQSHPQGFDMQGKLARVGLCSTAGVTEAVVVSGLT